MIKSDTIGKLVDALVKAQGAFDPILKDKKNPFFKSKYADLAAVIAATQSALIANGLVVVQLPVSDNERVGVLTILAHISGEFISESYTLPTVKQDAQSGVAAVTYARRTAYQGILGVAAEDDDGNTAAGRNVEPDSAPEPEPLPRRRVSQASAEDRGSRPEGGFVRSERTVVSYSKPPAAEIPDAAPTVENPAAFPQDLPLSEVTSDMTEEVDKGFIQTQPQMPAPAGAVASDTELAEFGKRLRALADDLGDKGGLKASRGLPVNRKVLAYLFKVTGMTDATKITLVQWNAFFQFTDKLAALPEGYVKLTSLVNGEK